MAFRELTSEEVSEVGDHITGGESSFGWGSSYNANYLGQLASAGVPITNGGAYATAAETSVAGGHSVSVEYSLGSDGITITSTATATPISTGGTVVGSQTGSTGHSTGADQGDGTHGEGYNVYLENDYKIITMVERRSEEYYIISSPLLPDGQTLRLDRIIVDGYRGQTQGQGDFLPPQTHGGSVSGIDQEDDNTPDCPDTGHSEGESGDSEMRQVAADAAQESSAYSHHLPPEDGTQAFVESGMHLVQLADGSVIHSPVVTTENSDNILLFTDGRDSVSIPFFEGLEAGATYIGIIHTHNSSQDHSHLPSQGDRDYSIRSQTDIRNSFEDAGLSVAEDFRSYIVDKDGNIWEYDIEQIKNGSDDNIEGTPIDESGRPKC